jgi:uncharacterized protein YacL
MPRVTRAGSGGVIVELVRLAIVVLATALAYDAALSLPLFLELRATSEGWTLAVVLLGSCIGYVLGGVLGRFLSARIEATERSLRNLSAGVMFAGAMGGFVGLVAAIPLVLPLFLFDAVHVTVPIAVLVATVLIATGVRVGMGRGGDLLRFLGASGRIDVASPSLGARAKLVDTSALIDGRLLGVCRSGFLEGMLVVPRFVLYELQGLADSGDDERRGRGRRGLDVLTSLQRSAGIALEVTDRDHPDVDTVDAKLVAMARERGAALVTVDANLARVAEVQGVKVLNLHQLAEDLRPPVLPGDLVTVRVVKPGKEAGQGVGYLADGTMVVVEGGRDRQGSEVSAEVTSILSNPNGRMVFATHAPAPHLVPRAEGE